jgi:hypothetical protein
MSKRQDPLHEISIDIGYSSTKVEYNGKLAKFPTAVSFFTDVSTAYGDNDIYDFEGKKYYVGSAAVSQEAFTTTDYKFLNKFAPLIIYHILGKFNHLPQERPIQVNVGLAVVDWSKKDEFIERISKFIVNDQEISVDVKIIPQGAGVAIDWVTNNNNNEYPEKLHILDIGYNTINSLHFINGRPDKSKIKTYPGHGVSSIIKPFTSFMENTYAISFSEQEALGVFTKGTFKYNGEDQPAVAEKIIELKSTFVIKLFQSVLVNDKKTLAMADKVLIAGGGAYILQGTEFPPNVEFVSEPYEFSNVRGYSL